VNFGYFPLWRIHMVVVLAPVVLVSGHSPQSYASREGWKNEEIGRGYLSALSSVQSMETMAEISGRVEWNRDHV
jgi:hypothetical protein